MKTQTPVTRDEIQQWKLDQDPRRGSSSMARNARLYAWWCDDARRTRLYEQLAAAFGDRTPFPSRAPPTLQAGAAAQGGHRTAYLLTGEEALEALMQPQVYSNRPYQALGERPLVLAHDGDEHKRMRERLIRVMRSIVPLAHEVEIMAAAAVQGACALPLKQRQFDLAPIAREAAVRFFVLMWGIPSQAVPLLIPAFDAAYRALNFLLVARHFEPYSQAKAREARDVVDKVGAQLSLWIDGYRRFQPHRQLVDEDAPDLARQLCMAVRTVRQLGNEQVSLENYVPMLARLAELGDPADPTDAEVSGSGAASSDGLLPPLSQIDFSSQDMATLVVEMLGGAIGQIQSCVCHAVRCARTTTVGRQHFERMARARPGSGEESDALVMLLAQDPPAPILARWARIPGEAADGAAGADYLIATASLPTQPVASQPSGACTAMELARARVFGISAHRCVGAGVEGGAQTRPTPDLALPVVRWLTRRIMGLTGLADQYHPVSREPLGLTQTWGSVCERYPLQYDARSQMIQGPLCIRMKVKAPVQDHAAQIKLILQYGAPRIETSLNRTEIVHFAWFQLVDNDSTLLLNTVFDGDMAAYLRVFADLEFPVFDALFEHLEDAPPTPVKHFQREFVEAVMRHHVDPALGYFYSAYPKVIARDVRLAFKPAGQA